ncbi:hypothetical protein TNCV_3346991 [Trichonephila clavipes]|nr:hypothetical protein TNCV_3346991 [Trichonephila clavipes]
MKRNSTVVINMKEANENTLVANNFENILRDCSQPKSILTYWKYIETGHKAKNYVSKSEKDYSKLRSLPIEKVGENSEECQKLSEAKLNKL